MSWTDNDVALQFATGELTAVMGADVLDGEKLAVNVEYRNINPVHIHDHVAAGNQCVRRTGVYPV